MIDDICSDSADVQKEAVQVFMARRSTRETITEGTRAYQGLIVLDTSTPAAAGGAGARRGLNKRGFSPLYLFNLCE